MESLVTSANEDDRIMLLVGDLGYGVVEPFFEKHPSNFINAGVSEQNMTGMAAGLAISGRVVFTYSIANFPTMRALEQIRNDIVYHRLPVTIVAVGTGFGYGVLGYSHHAVEDIAVMRSLPGMRILSPSSDGEVAMCVKLIASSHSPTYLRLDKDSVPDKISGEVKDVTSPRERFLGGSDIVILSTGSIASAVDEALERMSEAKSKNFTHYSLCQIKPMNLRSELFEKARLVVTVEEHSLSSGFGSAILEHLEGTPHISKVRRIAIPDVISELVGSSGFLREQSGIDLESLESRFVEFLG
jgi:transketolase